MLHKWEKWTVFRVIFLLAGLLVLIGNFLGIYIHQGFLALPILVGAMQIIFVSTGFCPMYIILRKAGIECISKK